MHKSLPELYKETRQFKNIPVSLRPGKDPRGWKSKEASQRLIAEGDIAGGGYYAVYAYADSSDLRMDVFRADDTLLERQQYNPIAKVYCHRITAYDEAGTKPVHFTATSADGRLVEEITRTADNQMERTRHRYHDLKSLTFYEEQKFGPSIACDRTLDREYRDNKGKLIEVDRHFEGNITRTLEYHPPDAEQAPEQKKKKEEIYENKVLKAVLEYRDDETLKTRTHYEDDGKTVSMVQCYNITGEHVSETRQFKKGKISKKIQMDADNTQEVKRILIYNDEGKPYRSRERNRWPAGDDFWNETELDPKTGHVISSLIPAPTGVIRQQYDPKTGRISLTESFREPELGETRQEAKYFYTTQEKASHPEQDKSPVVRRVEHFEEDGGTITDAKEFRMDGSVKFHEDRDGKTIRKTYYPLGTQQVDEDTPPIFESITRADGKMESSTLRAHPDPEIIALHKRYGDDGIPVEVTIETVKGEETLSWKEYVQRKNSERQPPPGTIRMATIAPEARKTSDKEYYAGSTVITFQGNASALKRAASDLKRRFADITCELNMGEKGWDQYRGKIGHYCNGSGGKQPAEKVDVLKVTIPYQIKGNESWPQSFTIGNTDNEMLKTYRDRAQEEAVVALTKVFRYTQCDLSLSIIPILSEHKTEKGTEYRPFVRVIWPKPPYLSEEHNGIVREMLTTQIAKRGFTCMPSQGSNEIDVLGASTTFQKGVAEKIMEDVSSKLSNGFVPALLRNTGAHIRH